MSNFKSYCLYLWICAKMWLYTIKGQSHGLSKIPWPMSLHGNLHQGVVMYFWNAIICAFKNALAPGPVYCGLKTVGPYMEPLFHINGQTFKSYCYYILISVKRWLYTMKGPLICHQKYHGPLSSLLWFKSYMALYRTLIS